MIKETIKKRLNKIDNRILAGIATLLVCMLIVGVFRFPGDIVYLLIFVTVYIVIMFVRGLYQLFLTYFTSTLFDKNDK